MRFQQFSFGQIRIDGIEYGYDVVIDRGEIRKRQKKPSKKFRDGFGHTPLSLGRGDTLEMPSLGGRHGHRSTSSHG